MREDIIENEEKNSTNLVFIIINKILLFIKINYNYFYSLKRIQFLTNFDKKRKINLSLNENDLNRKGIKTYSVKNNFEKLHSEKVWFYDVKNIFLIT